AASATGFEASLAGSRLRSAKSPSRFRTHPHRPLTAAENLYNNGNVVPRSCNASRRSLMDRATGSGMPLASAPRRTGPNIGFTRVGRIGFEQAVRELAPARARE